MNIKYVRGGWARSIICSIVFPVFLLVCLFHVVTGEITPEECQFGSLGTYIEIATYIEQWSSLHPYNTTKTFCSKNPICKYRYTPLVMGYIPSGVDIVFDRSRDNLVHTCGYLPNHVCCNGSCDTNSMVTIQTCQQATAQPSNVYIALLVAISIITVSVVMSMEDISTKVDNMLPMYKKGLPPPKEPIRKMTLFTSKSNIKASPPPPPKTKTKPSTKSTKNSKLMFRSL